MQCSECKRLRQKCQSAAETHRDLIHVREADGPTSTEPQIWDFVLEAAMGVRKQAQRELTDHRATHGSIFRSASMIFLALLKSDVREFADELLTAY
jgi:hypothetical protein